MVFPACHNPPVIVEPGDGSLDDPASFVPSEFAAILFHRPHTALAMRTNQIDSLLTKTITQSVRIGGPVIDQTLGLSILHCHFFKQWLDQNHFIATGRSCVDRHGGAMTINLNHNFSTFATAGRPDLITPFFAEANVPSAKVSVKLSWLFSSICSSIRCQATRKIPSLVHCWKRRWQVALEGYSFGKSFHRAPVTSTHKIPSRQSRGWTLGRPPFSAGGFQRKRSAIKLHC